MSIERSIHLDLGMPPQTDLQQQADSSGTPAQKDARNAVQLQQDVQSFETTLQGKASATPATTAVASSPFALFGQTPAVPAPSAESTPLAQQHVSAAHAGLEQALSQVASQLLVGQGRNGAATVQIQLEAQALQGVTLEVFEGEGALVAQFICTNEGSRERLVRAVDWLAQSLAERLSAAVLVRVLADDPEDPSPVESRAQAQI